MDESTVPSSSQHVLIVDDDGPTRALYARALARKGLSTLEAWNGEEALTVVRNEDVSLMLLDGKMPGLSGLQVIERLRSNACTAMLPIVMVTVADEVESPGGRTRSRRRRLPRQTHRRRGADRPGAHPVAATRRTACGLSDDVELAIDDAGAGYASPRHILALEPGLVKLDRDWIHEIDRDPARQALVAGLQLFATKTGCALVAEGIETADECETMRELGIRFGQGYYLGRPAALSLQNR